MNSSRQERFEQLLADRALVGLSAAETQDLQQLADQLGSRDQLEFSGFDSTVALLDLALSQQPVEPMPATLRAQIRHDAPAHLSRPTADTAGESFDNVTSFDEARARKQSSALAAGAGWLVAAAALLLAAFAWWPESPTAVQPRPTTPTLVQQVDELLLQPDVIRTAWAGTADPAGERAQGEVIWSPSKQQGYMRFTGLPANDPTQQQYQLWIFDSQRNADFPVDGGVFDIAAAEGETIVPIDARLNVDDATLFAVTIEKPGGVVVSSRERLVLLGQVTS